MSEQVQAPSPQPQESDRSTFLGAPPPEELQKQAQVSAKPAPPAPETPATPPPPKVSPHLVALAMDMGLPDAAEFSSDADLSRALAFAHRQRPQPHQEQKPAAPAAPVDPYGIPELDDRYDPGLIAMSKSMKAMAAKLNEALGLKDHLPELVRSHHQQMTAAEKVTAMIGDAMQESGYDRNTLDAQTRQRVCELGHALAQAQAKTGQKVDEKQIVKTILPLVLGQSSGRQPSQPSPQPANPTIEAQKAAIAAQRERDDKGRFLPGAPTHRVSENGMASALRSSLLDMGVDPGQAPAPDDNDFFLR